MDGLYADTSQNMAVHHVFTAQFSQNVFLRFKKETQMIHTGTMTEKNQFKVYKCNNIALVCSDT